MTVITKGSYRQIQFGVTANLTAQPRREEFSMRKFGVHGIAIVLSTLLISLLLYAQNSAGGLTLQGTVIRKSFLGNGDLHIWVQQEGKTTEVCLGPARLLEQNDLLPRNGETVRIVAQGSVNGVVQASSLSIGEHSLSLQAANTDGNVQTNGCPGCCQHHQHNYYHHHCWGCAE